MVPSVYRQKSTGDPRTQKGNPLPMMKREQQKREEEILSNLNGQSNRTMEQMIGNLGNVDGEEECMIIA